MHASSAAETEVLESSLVTRTMRVWGNLSVSQKRLNVDNIHTYLPHYDMAVSSHFDNKVTTA